MTKKRVVLKYVLSRADRQVVDMPEGSQMLGRSVFQEGVVSGDDHVAAARRELREMDRTLGAGRDLVVEVSKALTLAETTPGAEVRITCQTMADVVDAHRMLRGRHAAGLGLVPVAAERGYEHPRGSLITVIWCGGSTWLIRNGVDVRPLEEEKK